MNPLLISALLSAAISFGAAWQIQGYRMDSYKLEVANEKLAVEQSGRQAVSDAQKRVTAAQVASQVATDRVRADADRTVRSAVGLRDTLAASVRSATIDLAACTGHVATLNELLSTVVEDGGRIAKEADNWSVQAVTLQSARPSPPSK